jgi:hypothetical protein
LGAGRKAEADEAQSEGATVDLHGFAYLLKVPPIVPSYQGADNGLMCRGGVSGGCAPGKKDKAG